MRGCSLWARSFAQAGDPRRRVRMHIEKTTAVQNAQSHASASCLKHHTSAHTQLPKYTTSPSRYQLPGKVTGSTVNSCRALSFHYGFSHTSSRCLHVQTTWHTVNNHRVPHSLVGTIKRFLKKITRTWKWSDTLRIFQKTKRKTSKRHSIFHKTRIQK